jgi:hypothetical protein
VREMQLSTVLDVGAGYPAKIGMVAETSTTLLDQLTPQPIVQRDFPNAEFVADDLEHPSRRNGRTFDLVICADVVEHLIDPDPCMKIIRSATRRFAILSTPERDIVRGTDCMHSPKEEHVREWNAREFRRYVESHGFQIVQQRLLPQGRLRPIELGWARLLRIRTPRWSGCQAVLCIPR